VEEKGPAIWDLHPDGTCQIEKVTARYEGSYLKNSIPLIEMDRRRAHFTGEYATAR
jgi:hypothetical protein